MTENFLSPGVTVREKRAGVPQIRGGATSVGAIIGRALRGPAGTAIRLDSFAKFVRIFGTYDPDSYMAESVDAFFKNGGSALYAVRALGSGGGSNVKASVAIATVAGAVATSGTDLSDVASFPANLPAGTVFDGTVDGGASAGFTIAATVATRTGAAATYGAGAGGDNIVINITGVLGNQTIDLSAAAATQASYLAIINAGLIGGRVVDAAGQLQLETDQAGSGAAGSIVSLGGAAAAKTGLSAGAFTNAGPNNVANAAAVTAAEFASLATAGFAGSAFTTVGTDRVRWTSNTTGVSSSVQFSSPANVATLIPGFDLAAHAGSASTTQTAVTVTSVGEGSDANGQRAKITREDVKVGLPTAALAADIGPGAISQIVLTAGTAARVTKGDTLKFSDSSTAQTIRGVVAQVKNATVLFESPATLGGAGLTVATTTVTLETFTLTILENSKVIQGPLSGLRMSSLSDKNYFMNRINTIDDENTVTVADGLPAVQPNDLDVRPNNVDSTGDLLAGGSEATTFADADWLGSSVSGTGLYALSKKYDVRLIAIPGVTGTVTGAVSKGLVEYCATREDCIAILETPANTAVAAALTFKNDNIGSSSYGVFYYPWVEIVSPLTGQRVVSPPSAYVMGMIGRTDRERVVAKAPAGELVGQLRGIVGVERIVTDDERNQLYPSNINPIEFIEGVGVSVMGSRTMETGEFGQINVRRVFIYLRAAMKTGTRFVLFEGNDPPTRAKVRRTIASFLRTEWKNGNLEGETSDEAFYVTCDESNNPPTTVNEGKMYIEVGVNIPKTTEFLVIEIMQDQRGIEASLGV